MEKAGNKNEGGSWRIESKKKWGKAKRPAGDTYYPPLSRKEQQETGADTDVPCCELAMTH